MLSNRLGCKKLLLIFGFCFVVDVRRIELNGKLKANITKLKTGVEVDVLLKLFCIFLFDIVSIYNIREKEFVNYLRQNIEYICFIYIPFRSSRSTQRSSKLGA